MFTIIISKWIGGKFYQFVDGCPTAVVMNALRDCYLELGYRVEVEYQS